MNDPTEPAGSAETTADEIIRPVGYQPQQRTEEKRFDLTRGQIIAICIAVPTLIIVWFLFTAKSVRLEFSPPMDSATISGGLSFELGGIHLLREGEYRVAASATDASSRRPRPEPSKPARRRKSTVTERASGRNPKARARCSRGVGADRRISSALARLNSSFDSKGAVVSSQ